MYRPPVTEDADLHHHIDALWRLLGPRAELIDRIKSAAAVGSPTASCTPTSGAANQGP